MRHLLTSKKKYVVTSIKNDNGMKNDNANDKSEKSIVTAPKDKGDKLKMVNEKKKKTRLLFTSLSLFLGLSFSTSSTGKDSSIHF